MNGFTTLEVALNWFATFKSKNVNNHRSFLLEQVNDVRRLLYGFYEDVQLFEDDQECFCVQKFTKGCGSCDDFYYGITLPASLISPSAMWKANTPIKLHSKWREYKTGLRPTDMCLLESHQQGGNAATERDIFPINSACQLAFMSEKSADDGKAVTIRYVDVGGQIKEEKLVLAAGQKVTTSSSALSVADQGVILPANLEGSVTLMQANGTAQGRILSSYAPHEVVPSYTRLKLTGVCEDDVVLVRGARRYIPLYFDDDVMETDNKLALEQAVLFLEHNRATNPESIQKATYHVKACKELLLGEKSREQNKSTVKKLVHTSYRRRHKGLRSKRANGSILYRGY